MVIIIIICPRRDILVRGHTRRTLLIERGRSCNQGLNLTFFRDLEHLLLNYAVNREWKANKFRNQY